MQTVLLMLALNMASIAPLPYGMPRYSLLSPERAVSFDTQIGQMLFAGLGGARNGRVLRMPVDARLADRFRHDEAAVWSPSTASQWRILPPVLLGSTAKAGTPTAECAICISDRTIMMTGEPDATSLPSPRLRTLPPGVAPVASAWE